MTYLQKLTDLVCQEKDIEKDLKELKFWCKLKSKINWNELFLIKNNYIEYDTTEWIYNNTNVEIIWNPLELHHLMWYCELKWIYFKIENYTNSREEKLSLISIRYHQISYNNTKPLSQQNEEVLKNIFEALAS